MKDDSRGELVGITISGTQVSIVVVSRGTNVVIGGGVSVTLVIEAALEREHIKSIKTLNVLKEKRFFKRGIRYTFFLGVKSQGSTPVNDWQSKEA